MQKGVFPTQLFKGIKDQPALLNLNHISHFIELSQLGPKEMTDYLWLHTDPVSVKDETVQNEVRKKFIKFCFNVLTKFIVKRN